MAKVIFNSTTGNIAGVFIDSVAIPVLPVGYLSFIVSGNVNSLVDKHVDVSGPAIEELDFIKFTGPTNQTIATVVTHGVQKADGDTQLDLVAASDNEGITMRLGDTTMAPGTSKGFIEDPPNNLVFGAAAFRLAGGNVAGPETLFVKAAGLKIAKKVITYI